MSTHQTHEPGPDDRELDALLAREGRVHAAWRDASTGEPPAALDDAIRAAARRAVRAGPRPAGAAFAARWRVPLSIAAVLVVSATLTLLLSERGEHVPGAELRSAPVAPEADAVARDAAKPAQSADLGDAQPSTPPAAAESRAQKAPRARQEATPAKKESQIGDTQDALAKERGEPAPQEALADGQRAKRSARADAEQPAAPPASPAPAAEAPARAAAAPTPVPPAPAGANVAVPPAQAASRAEPAASAEVESGAEDTPLLEPQVWIERILALRREGRVQEAQRSLEQFRRRYPDYRLPPELAALPRAPAPD